MAEKRIFDVLILGAGPSGIAAAIVLADSGLSIGIIEKSGFPREKTCGDGLTLDIVNQLKIIAPELYEEFLKLPFKTEVHETLMFSPKNKCITIPSYYAGKATPFYTCRRSDFDNFLYQYALRFKNIEFILNSKAQEVFQKSNSIALHTDDMHYEGKILIFADGANSMSTSLPGRNRKPGKDLTLGIRTYYKGVNPLSERNPIEIYYMKDILPGYLWIFPMGNGLANVGMGVSLAVIQKKEINIKEKFDELLESDIFKNRFKNAQRLEPVKGHILPMSGKKENISGNRFVVTGDAAALVDPFSGEGVGNAIRSGRVAAEHIKKCFLAGDFSESFNKAYDKEIYRRVGHEFRMGRMLIKLCKFPFIINSFIGIINKSSGKKETFRKAICDYSLGKKRKGLHLILAILRLLIAR